jgi:hypothetical protein
MWKPIFLAALVCAAAPAVAQTFPIKFTGQHSSHFKGKKRIAIGSYGINYVVAQQGTAVAGVGLNSKVVTGLTGVDEATMRRLADEGYADLKSQLAAAGYALAGEDEVRSVLQAGGAALRPGNTESHRDGGITIGKSVKEASVAYGASAAALTDTFPVAGSKFGLSALGSIGKIQKLGKAGVPLDAILLFPMLTVDYADTEAKQSRTLTGARRGTVETNVAFGIRMMSSTVQVINPGYTQGAFYVGKDVFVPDDFTASPQTITAMSNDSAYALNVVEEQKKGNVVVDLPKWTVLVRAAYRAYNAGIVAVVREQHKA